MNIEKLISISGRPGLFSIVSQNKGNFIVEELVTKKRMAISTQNRVSLLENIAIYTTNEEVPLKDVLVKVAKHTQYKEAIFHKKNENKLREFMLEIMPEYDKEKVYESDLKKLFNWYNLLLSQGLISKEAIEKAEKEKSLEIEEEREDKNFKVKKDIILSKEAKKIPIVKTQGKVNKVAGNSSAKGNMNKKMG